MKINSLSDWKKIKSKGLRRLFPSIPRLSVGLGSCGIAAGAEGVYRALKKVSTKKNLDILVTKTGCLGFCGEEPLLNLVRPHSPLLVFHRVTEEDAKQIIEKLADNEVYEQKILCKIEGMENVIDSEGIIFGHGFSLTPHFYEIPFYKKQRKIVLRESGLIDPESIDEFIAVGGYSTLIKTLSTLSPEEVLKTIHDAGLRGRGGAGFPTALKWEIARKAKSDKKYIVCNADEGDPGAYMNRNEMESDPHMLLEGMIIGAYAIGADEGIIYVRTEYPLAIERLRI
ncbi:MAG: NADH-quinone oxidoreductase subunit J/K, partial [Pseudomonadota bacterium]